jgi:hypothetical protein
VLRHRIIAFHFPSSLPAILNNNWFYILSPPFQVQSHFTSTTNSSKLEHNSLPSLTPDLKQRDERPNFPRVFLRRGSWSQPSSSRRQQPIPSRPSYHSSKPTHTQLQHGAHHHSKRGPLQLQSRSSPTEPRPTWLCHVG